LKKDQKQLLMDYHQVFNYEAGKRILYDLMLVGHILHPSYVKGDSHEMAFREGERNMVLRILNILKTTPEQFDQRIKERENG
jgi:hypothetical protein